MPAARRPDASRVIPTPADTPIDEADRTLLRFVALHRATNAAQVPVLLGISPRRGSERLRRLEAADLLRRERIFHGRPSTLSITAAGSRAVGIAHEPGGTALTEYRHDLGVSWLWLAARDGAFGPLREIRTERELRSGTPGPAEALGPAVADRAAGERHRPDLLLTTDAGKRIAIELELTPKGSRRLEGIMLGFAGDPEIDAVLYLVPTAALARLVGGAAQRAGVAKMVHVQRVAPDGIHGAPATESTPSRSSGSTGATTGATRAGRPAASGTRERGGAER